MASWIAQRFDEYRRNFRHDLLASLVVFLVALPLCMGIAIASGVPASAGLITGIIGGIVVGVLTGSPLQVSGPAAGLTVIVYEIVGKFRESYLAEHGGTEGLSEEALAALESAATTEALLALGVVLMLAGTVQIAAGALKLGQWFRAVSPAVVEGMLAGIGVLIIASQIHVTVDDVPSGEGLENLLTIPQAVFRGVFPLDGNTHHLAAATGIVTVATMILWGSLTPKKLRLLPSALVGIVTATVFAHLMQLDIKQITVPHNLLEDVVWPSTASLSLLRDQSIYLSAIVVAVVASAETLLCATAVDQMHIGPRTKYDRELAAQGVGNICCGALGALPMTGVIVRSSANVQAGGRTNASTIMHGLWLLILVVALPGVLNLIPRAALGALLVYTGVKLVNVKGARHLWATSRGEFFIYAATLVTVVVVDLLTGVLVGVAISALRLLVRFSHLEIETEHDPDSRRINIRLAGRATFLRLPKLIEVLEGLPADSEVHLDVEQLEFIDHACLDMLKTFSHQHEAKGGRLVVEWDSLQAQFNRSAERMVRRRRRNRKPAVSEETQVADSAATLKEPARNGGSSRSESGSAHRSH